MISKGLQMRFLMGWHAILGGGFIVAYSTGEVSAGMHLLTGTVVLIAAAVRLIVGLLAPASSLLALKRPQIGPTADWGKRLLLGDGSALRGRPPIHDLVAVIVLSMVGLAAASGWLADTVRWTDDLHEGLANASLFAVLGHVGLIWGLAGLRRLMATKPTAERQSPTRAPA